MRPALVIFALLIAKAALAQEPVFVINPAGHSARIQAILPTPDQKRIYTFGADKTICVWDVATGHLIRKKWLDIGGGDEGRFIDADLGRKSGIVAVARINSLGRPVVNIIDVMADRILGTFEGFSHDLGFVRIDPDERFIITGTSGNIYSEPTRLWKLPKPAPTPFTIGKATAETEGIVMHDFTFYNDGHDILILAMQGEDASFHINYDASAIPEYSFKKQPLPLKRVGHMGYSRAIDYVFSVTHEGEVTLFNHEKLITVVPRRKNWSTAQGDSASQRVAINHQGTFAVASGGIRDAATDFMEVYDVTKRKKLTTLSGWFQSATFVSDTTVAFESGEGFCVYNIVNGQRRVFQRAVADVNDAIRFGAENRVMFDSMRQVFDFQELKLESSASGLDGFSASKTTYHNTRLEIPEYNQNGLFVNDRFASFFPHGPEINSVSFVNDGRLIAGRRGYRTHAYFLLMYDLSAPVEKDGYEAVVTFDGTFGMITSIAPHPERDSSLFATRDRLGVITLFDTKGPSTTVFRNLLRFWPFVKLNLDVTGKGTDVLALPKEGYNGVLKKGDRLIAINGFRPGNKEAIIRYLETLDPVAPVDLEVSRGSQTLHSSEKLNSLEMRSPLVSFIPLPDNEWLCWTPQGYYAASADGERHAGWVISKGVNAFAEFHPVYDFKKQFYKPELIRLVAKHGSFEKAVTAYNAKAEQPLSVSGAISEKLPPSIRWINPMRDTAVNRSTVRFVASVQSSSKLQAAKILLNGRTILRRDQITIRQERDAPLYTISFELDLPATDNIVNIFAENEFGSTVSGERLLRMNSSEIGIERYKPNLYLLSVGVSSHSIPAYALSYADNDARGVEQLYQSQQGKLFRNVFTKTLVNEQATRTGILEAFYWLEQNATQKDVVVIFMASHGFNDKDKFYILPYDGDPERIRITGVDWSNFADVLGNLPSKVLVFVDACHSGKLGTNIGAKRGDTDLMEAIRTLATEENGVVIMAASTGKESSLESPEWKHGAFTLALLEGLGEGKADINGDNIVNIREIDYYVAERVKILTNGRQHPTTQKPSVVSEFPLVMKK